MSDQGYPGAGYPGPGGDPAGQPPYQPPGEPQYGQQPPYQPPAQPPYGQPTPPPAQPPYQPPSEPQGQPPYGQPGQPQYGQPTPPQYGQPPQPAYGQPEYGQQYGQQPYGQPQYPGAGDTAQYGAVPPQYPPTGGYPAGAPTGGGGTNKGLIAGLGALVVAAIVVAILLLAGVFSSSASATPQDAVKKLLNAGKTGDISAAKSVLCAADNSLGVTSQLGKTRIKSYTIGKVTKKNSDEASVSATVVTSDNSTPTTEALPVVKEGGAWKVCISRLGLTPSTVPQSSASVSSPSSAPSGFPSASVPSVSIPSITGAPTGALGGINPCNYATSLGDAAEIYVAAAETGQIDLAQSCVRSGAVPRSVTESIKAKSTSDYYDPTPTVSGTVAHFKSISGSHTIDVTVEKSGTGYSIVAVTVS